METQQHHSQSNKHTRVNLALIAFLLIAAFFLFSEHRAHFFGILPFLFLLACLFLHMFMHGGHGEGNGAGGRGEHRGK
ncbi:MAG: DUF2933 domain-containing protein [Candidatus Manganitrophaceae bacterium]